jgi:hypothetical protein
LQQQTVDYVDWSIEVAAMVEGWVTLTRRARGVLFLLIVLAVAALAIGPAGIVQQAQARWKSDFANAPYATWYAQQHDQEGWSCCDRADAHPVYDAYIKLEKWFVPIGGIYHEIQPNQLLDGPNPTGHAVVWYDGGGDNVTIFCFAPGPLY